MLDGLGGIIIISITASTGLWPTKEGKKRAYISISPKFEFKFDSLFKSLETPNDRISIPV